MAPYALLAASLLGFVTAQTPGTTPEVHPKLTTWKCTKAGGCQSQNTALVIDAATHNIHQKNNSAVACDPTACTDVATCAENCIVEGIQDYSNYGVYTSGGDLRMDMYKPNGSIASPRIYLLAEDEKDYELLQLTGNEFSFDVDVSKLPCGMNGALYLSEMEASGGRSDLNPAGAAYGTGYCDAQCYVKPWINGVANIKNEGICCNEMDIWEANDRATQTAPHVCSKPGLFGCTGDECTKSGLCDKSGCGDNPYRSPRNDKTFYGLGLQVDTTKPFTVVTQFPAENGTLQAIVRKYVQDGVVIDNAVSNITMNQAFCDARNSTDYARLGGHKQMGEALARGMVLALSIWWDESGGMSWLDTGSAGPCNATEGFPATIEKVESRPTVTFSQIKWGEIGSTFAEQQNGGASYRWRA